MKNLIIIGARGFGREVYHLATQCQGYLTDFAVKGFLDDQADALSGITGYPPILGAVEAYAVQPGDVFVCALGSAKFKKHYVGIMLNKGGEFLSLCHPSAMVNRDSEIGPGAIILANVFVSCEVRLGAFVTLQPFCAIGHDAQIGAYCHLNAYAFMGGFAECSEGVTLHTGAKVLPHKKVGAWATVGVGSVVLRNVKPGQTVFGMPAIAIEG
jgi:sugar O-acyltransferase (sialic acid O-acetyltransferase NeuD family)